PARFSKASRPHRTRTRANGCKPSALPTAATTPPAGFPTRIPPGTACGGAPPSASQTTDLYAAITRVAGREFPGTPVLPMMSTGFSDSWELRMRNVQAYGLVPFPMTDDDWSRVHGENERIPIHAFRKGLDFLYPT